MMKELWGILGGILTVPQLHSDLLTLALKGEKFEQLEEFSKAIWHIGLGLGRWEIMTLQLILIESHTDPVGGKIKIGKPEDDMKVQRIQKRWSDLGLPLPTEVMEEIQMLSALGCAAIDTSFRRRVVDAADPAKPPNLMRLKSELVQDPPQGPQFFVSEVQLETLNTFLVSQQGIAVNQLEEFRNAKWVQPNPCPVGYTFGEGRYAHLSWPRLLAASLQGPGKVLPLMAQLRELTVLIGGE
jgi:hypothetical protein